MVCIVDYGVGNLFSLKSSLQNIGAEVVVTDDENVLRKADQIILPGVGAFRDASQKLRDSGLHEVLVELANNGKPLMGICLGMQLLFDKSYEYGSFEGLSLISGDICPIKDDVPNGVKIPHIGWNKLQITDKNNKLFKYINDGDCVYFVHSYYAKNCSSNTIATSEYYTDITACVANRNVYGCQFHPEKSGSVGLNILKAFVEIKEEV